MVTRWWTIRPGALAVPGSPRLSPPSCGPCGRFGAVWALAVVLWSASTASVQAQLAWVDSLVAQEAGGRPVTLSFGRHAQATVGLDYALGEVEQPPLPPSGSFDIRFTGRDLGNGVLVDLRPAGVATPDTLRLSYQLAEDHPLTLTWSARRLGAVVTQAWLVDPFGGAAGVNVDMLKQDQAEIPPGALSSLRLILITRTGDHPGPVLSEPGSWGWLKESLQDLLDG